MSMSIEQIELPRITGPLATTLETDLSSLPDVVVVPFFISPTLLHTAFPTMLFACGRVRTAPRVFTVSSVLGRPKRNGVRPATSCPAQAICPSEIPSRFPQTLSWSQPEEQGGNG